MPESALAGIPRGPQVQQKPQIIPQVPQDDFMIEHAKAMASTASAAPKRTRWPFSAGRKEVPQQESAR